MSFIKFILVLSNVTSRFTLNFFKKFMSLLGFEPRTSTLSEWHSNQAELQAHKDNKGFL